MKDKKIIILAVILLALVGYYVWYVNKTKVVEHSSTTVQRVEQNPQIALLRKMHKGIQAYKKEKGNVPKSLDELKGKYVDAKTIQQAKDNNFEYKYVNSEAYRLTAPKTSGPVMLATKKKAPQEKPPGSSTTTASSSPTTTTELATTETGWKYDPTGKPDPFKAFILASAATEEAPTVVRRQLTPLQKMPLSEIQAGLKAIIWGQLGNKALVEDATGKGYVVQEGTYVGQHDGIVKKIYQDRIIVEEYRRDSAKGRLEPTEVVLKLKKVEAEE
ncbi:MAG: pilus assembly protein PilP [Deltaproteobacteria bacterium]|nr:pilus assembly protein PilP [Deltaproteobacteria bacterium]